VVVDEFDYIQFTNPSLD
jgi:hypothetical protein